VWGGTAGAAAIWLVQPFDWIANQLKSEPESE
jgi:hypothetical protein